MRVLLSTIGSRGDVQPLVALALELRALGHDARLCVPPDFREWIESLGFAVVPIGPELRSTGRASPAAAPPTPEQRRRMVEASVATQFETIAAAARDRDVIVGATALQIAAPSVAERAGIPYVFAAYCPAVLPSPRHAPPVLAMRGDTPAGADADFAALWERDAARFAETFGDALNTHRASIGLPPVGDVRGYVMTSRPWLAADATLAPWPDPDDGRVLQTGAWLLRDERPLSAELERFLDAGDPPIYFGFGSNRATENLARVMIESARALGRRAVLLRGWAELSPIDDAPDCIAIGEVNQQALFARVAAVVHHGGAGTTTTAARAGAPQVIVAQHYDQHYWAGRVAELGVGAAHDGTTPTAESLTRALEHALRPEVATRARALAPMIRSDGARVAATLIVSS